MSKKDGRLSINALDVFENTNEMVDQIVDGFEFKVKKYLSCQEKVDFVNSVINTATVEGQYVPALFEYAWRVSVLYFFTNITLPKNQERVNDIVFGTKIYDSIKLMELGHYEFQYLKSACDEKLKRDLEFDKIAMQSVLNPDPLNRVVDMLEGWLTQNGDLVKNLDINNLNALLGKIDNISDNQIIDAVVDNTLEFPKKEEELKVAESTPTKKTRGRPKKVKVEDENFQVEGQISVDEVDNN